MSGETILGGWPIPTIWIAETLIATTLLMIAVLLLRRPVARACGARVAYLLWLAPALRMLLPPLPQSWFPAAAMPAVPPVSDATAMVAQGYAPVVIDGAVGGGVAWQTLSLSVWLGGATLFFAWHWLAYARFARAALADADHLDSDAPLPVVASRAISSPVALGIFARRVLVPHDFAHRYDAVEQRLALDHELTHHRRLDLPVNLAALAMLSLHWFNPIAHIAHRAFRLDQEAACDALVLAHARPADRFAYGTALYKSATGAMPLAVCALGDASQLKSRLRLIVSGEASRAWMQCGGALAAVMVLLSVIVTASSQVAAVAAQRVEPPAVAVAPLRSEVDRASIAAERRAALAAAKAQRAQALADVARQRSDRARRLADRARARGQIAPPAILSPFAAPAAPAALLPPAPVVPIAPPVPTVRVSDTCTGHGGHATVERHDRHGHLVSVSICRRTIVAEARASAVQGVLEARNEVANDPTIPAAVKSEILASLDDRIRRLRLRVSSPH